MSPSASNACAILQDDSPGTIQRCITQYNQGAIVRLLFLMCPDLLPASAPRADLKSSVVWYEGQSNYKITAGQQLSVIYWDALPYPEPASHPSTLVLQEHPGCHAPCSLAGGTMEGTHEDCFLCSRHCRCYINAWHYTRHTFPGSLYSAAQCACSMS
jgi:hypothetical protein